MAKTAAFYELCKIYSVTGSFDPSDFRFHQADANKVDKLFAEKAPAVEFRTLAPVLDRMNQSYVGTNGTPVADLDKKMKDTKGNPTNPNPGAQDVASLDADKDTLVVVGGLRFTRQFDKPVVTDNEDYRAYHADFVSKYIGEGHLPTLMRRYLENIVNGRVLWRNQYGFARRAVLTLKTLKETKHYHLESEQDEAFNDLVETASAIAADPKGFFRLDIALCVELGFDAEVYPSQPFLTADGKKNDKLRNASDKESYGRVLSTRLTRDGEHQVIFSSQKFGHALRMVDTSYAEDAVEPIAIEAYGVVTSQRTLHRNKNSFFSLLKKSYEELSEGDKHFMFAMFVKGGLLSAQAS